MIRKASRAGCQARHIRTSYWAVAEEESSLQLPWLSEGQLPKERADLSGNNIIAWKILYCHWNSISRRSCRWRWGRAAGRGAQEQWQLTHVKGSSSDAASAAAASPVATSTLRSIVFANCCLLFVVLSNRLRFASAQPELSTAQQLSLFLLLFLSLALHLTSLDEAPSLSCSLCLSPWHTRAVDQFGQLGNVVSLDKLLRLG